MWGQVSGKLVPGSIEMSSVKQNFTFRPFITSLAKLKFITAHAHLETFMPNQYFSQKATACVFMNDITRVVCTTVEGSWFVRKAPCQLPGDLYGFHLPRHRERQAKTAHSLTKDYSKTKYGEWVCRSSCSCCCGTTSWGKQLRKSGLVFVHSCKVKSNMVGKSWYPEL